MSIPQSPTRDKATDAILSGVRISAVYRQLTSIEPRRGGPGSYRVPGIWRGGDGKDSVSLNDVKNTWYDFVAGRGGGILDLIVEIRGGSRQDALLWLADVAGFPLDDKPFSAADRAHWAAERRRIERDLPSARLWRRSAIDLGEELLMLLKALYFDAPAETDVTGGELQDVTQQLARWHLLDGAGLVNEFHGWRDKHPQLTSAMVQAARLRETAECRAVLRYLMETGE